MNKNIWTDTAVTDSEISKALTACRVQLLQLGGQALSRFMPNEQHSSQLTLHLTEAQFLAMKTRLQERDREMMQLTEHVDSGAVADRVYVLVNGFFPLSDYTD